MEFVWMIPLYIFIPIAGILLLIWGFRAAKGEGKKRIGFGLLLLSLPFLHSFLVSKVEINREKLLIGYYRFEDKSQVILTLQPDYNFKLEKSDSLDHVGSGTWKYNPEEFRRIELFFHDSSQLDFHVGNEDNKTYLSNSFWTGTYHRHVRLIRADNKQ